MSDILTRKTIQMFIDNFITQFVYMQKVCLNIRKLYLLISCTKIALFLHMMT